ncbi:hypothetical protein AB6A40_007131 [Gnathostoma spinigerum]|uniref:Uncharacterized protein n=1 Tax=Gnathostoma spinigerum TaxID=75299 RepID=A0ABD6EV25_9BILA
MLNSRFLQSIEAFEKFGFPIIVERDKIVNRSEQSTLSPFAERIWMRLSRIPGHLWLRIEDNLTQATPDGCLLTICAGTITFMGLVFLIVGLVECLTIMPPSKQEWTFLSLGLIILIIGLSLMLALRIRSSAVCSSQLHCRNRIPPSSQCPAAYQCWTIQAPPPSYDEALRCSTSSMPSPFSPLSSPSPGPPASDIGSPPSYSSRHLRPVRQTEL